MQRILLAFTILCAGCVCGAPRNDVGAQYLGTPYAASPLGEGYGYDADPLIRFDAFDCTTFVETVLANGDATRLTKIRYRDGNATFINRNHFIETDWIQNNSDIVENVSTLYGPTAIRNVIIDKTAWLRTVHNIDSDIQPVATTIEYIPYAGMPEIRNTKPLIVLFITGKSQKSDKIGTDLAVVHMGFLLPGGILRHASSAAGMVIDTDFAEYAHKRQSDKNNLGIALLGIK